MVSPAPTTMSMHVANDNGSPKAMPPTTGLARHDTNSSVGSARRPSHGSRIINISGACPSCHHQHRSLQVHVRIVDDFDQVGDVYCKRCGRLWVAFGNANATRLSLLSTLSIEPDPIENAFRGTLIHMIRSVTPIAVLSPTLTVIPEAASASVSRETSVRSIAGRDVRRPATNNLNAVETSVANDISSHKYGKRSLANGRRILSTVTHKARARFFRSGKIPFGLGKWFSKGESLTRGSHQQDSTSATIDTPHNTVISTPPVHEHTESREEVDASFDLAALDVSASSTNAMDALNSLKALNPQVLQHLPHQEQISWARRQLTDFRARHSSITAYMTTHGTGSGEGLHGLSGSPRPNSILACVGGGFESYEDWDSLREHGRTTNGRPWSMSDTGTSDADTLVDDRSIASTPQHIFVETLHRDHPRSLSPRPISMRSIAQDWSQFQRSRAEARRSIDSTMTGGNVRSITTARNHALNRLSRGSTHRASSIFGIEPTNSRPQLRVGDIQEDGAPPRPRSPSPSLPRPDTDGTNPRE